jgi:hypothetical protein
MAQRTVKPEKVKTLRDWVARWPKATNLRFDEETREPVVLSVDGAGTQVGSFPWRREGDTITILTQSSQFSQQAVGAARKRLERIQERSDQMRAAGEEALRSAEAQLMETWRAYTAAPPAVKAGMRRDLLTAERTVRDLEAALAAEIYPERVFDSDNGMNSVYNPPMPMRRRGIPLSAVAGDEEVEEGPSAGK